jgi:predicted nucleic acid-binding protein
MVDTQTLIYATRPVSSKTQPADAEMIRASKHLLRSVQRISVSAIVAAEYIPHAADDSLWDRFEIIAFDAAQAHRAAWLARHLKQSGTLCPGCLNPKTTPRKCVTCKHHVDRRSREQDLRIAAAAECAGFSTLYTFDGWLLQTVAPLVNCVIREPPNPDGPLFSGGHGAGGEVVQLKPAANE